MPLRWRIVLRVLGARRRSNKPAVAGVLDGVVLRTSGYLPGADDVPVPPETAARFGLRPGDAVRGNGNPLAVVTSVNGLAPGAARPDFYRLATTDPHQQLSLGDLTLLKGQAALLRVPFGAQLADLAPAGVPGVHLMLVIVDVPAAVLAKVRAVEGELVTSGAERAPAEHGGMTALVIERAKRLAELNHHVVILFDSVSRLGRSDPAGGRLARQLLGSARSIKDGGSLTVVAGYDGSSAPHHLGDLGCIEPASLTGWR